jgi:membrane protease YdiL (CAAX protease family)
MSTTRETRGTCNHQRRRSRAGGVWWCLLLVSGAMFMCETVAFQQVSISIPSNKLILSRARSITGASYQESTTSTSLLFRSPSSHSNSNNLRRRPRQRRTNDRGIWSNADAVAYVYDDDGSDINISNKLTRPYSLRTVQQAFGVVTDKLFRMMHVTAEQHPLVQMMIAVALYTFHLTVLTQHAVVFPYQLIPTTLVSSSSSSMSSAMGAAGTGIGWDSLAGMATLGLYAIYKRQKEQQRESGTTIETKEKQKQKRVFPWQLPANNNRHKLSFLVASVLLTQAYFFTGQFSLYWEDLLYTMSARGWPLTAPMHRSLCVLLGHVSWVVAGSTILWAVPRPPPFFGKQLFIPKEKKEVSTATAETTTTNSGSSSAVDEAKASASASATSPSLYYSWFRSQWHSKWLWWAIGGYFVSSWLFNVADQLNQCILPAQVLMEAQESVVSQLVNPEHNDLLASVVGYIAPCLTAPVWEEVLYRGFALAGLTAWTGRFHVAAVVQAVIFSAHHMSVTAAIPLFVLGWIWAMLYAESRNLFTVIFVHALWNSRVFLGSWLGL